MPLLVVSCQFQIRLGCCLRLLQNAVQQNHPLLFVQVEKHSRDTIFRETRTHFIQSAAHWATNRHSNRPAVFHRSDIFPDQSPILGWHFLQPIANRFVPGFRSIKSGSDSFQAAWAQCTSSGTSLEVFPSFVLHFCKPLTQRIWNRQYGDFRLEEYRSGLGFLSVFMGNFEELINEKTSQHLQFRW